MPRSRRLLVILAMLASTVCGEEPGGEIAGAPAPLPPPETEAPVDPSIPPQEEGLVTFVFYNLRNYLAMERRVDGVATADAPKPEEEVAEVVAALAHLAPDILGVCEIGDERFLEDLRRRLAEEGLSLPHGALLTSADGNQRNLGLLTRFPVVANRSRGDYVYDLGGRRLPFQRGVLDATLDLGEGRLLRYVGLHLKSRREVPEGDQAEMRLRESLIARRHIESILAVDPETRLLVAGDLNDYRHEAPVRTLQGRFGSPDYLAVLPLADRHGFRWTHHWDLADLYSRIDFVLHSRSLGREIRADLSGIHHWDRWSVASDHRPLVARFLLGAE